MASGAGMLLTLPFDIYNAVSAFQQAGVTSGKLKQDNYVAGGFAVAGIATTGGLTAAAMAGLSSAGPIGLAAGVALASAHQMYHAVRYVEDIERYVPLSHGDRALTGLYGFFGSTASQSILDQVSTTQAREQYRDNKRDQLLSYLKQSPHKHAIFGDADIRARPPVERLEIRLAPGIGGPYRYRVKVFDQRPADVRDNAGDDDIDASGGLQHVSNRVTTPHGAATSVLWVTGDGRDRLKGAQKVSNVFDVHSGEKDITGGKKNDRFDLAEQPAGGSRLDGGDGQDTLALHFSTKTKEASKGSKDDAEADVHVVLPMQAHDQSLVEGTFWNGPGLIHADGQNATLLNIDNIVTSPTARTRVTGNGHDNVIVLNGDGDSATGGGGNDTFVINGAGNVGIVSGQGKNRYVIGHASSRVDIDNSAATSGKHHVQVDADIGDLSVIAAGAALEIRLNNRQSGSRVVLSQIFEKSDQGHNTPRLADGDIVITTRDGYVVMPTLSSISEHADGVIAMVAMTRTNA